MTANVTRLEDNRVRLDVEVPPDAVRQGVEAKVRELGRKVRVPGFRPGKAPRRVIENHLGRDYIYMEALQEELPGWYSQAVVETDLGLEDAISLGRVLIRRGLNAQMTSTQLKGTPDTLENGNEVLVPDETANEAALERFASDGAGVRREGVTGSAGSSHKAC